MAKITNFNHEKGTLAEVIKGADVFIGVSAPGTLTQDMVRSMAKRSDNLRMREPHAGDLPG